MGILNEIYNGRTSVDNILIKKQSGHTWLGFLIFLFMTSGGEWRCQRWTSNESKEH